MEAGLLRHVHKCPAVFQGIGRGDLDGRVLAMLHGIEGNRDVVYPVGADIDQVDVIPLAEFLESFSGAAVSGDIAVLPVSEGLLGFLHPVGFHVADCDDPGSGNAGKACDCAASPHSEAYDTYPYCLELRGHQSDHVGLPGGPCRHRSYYGSFGVLLETAIRL